MNSFPSRFHPRLFAPCPTILPRWHALIIRHLCAAVFAGFLVTATMAQQTTVSGGGVIIQQYSGPPPPPPQPRPETSDSGPSLGPEGGRPYSHYPNTYVTDYGSRPLGPFFLPTNLPVLGTTPPANRAPLAADYPREFAGEPFFMPYGNLAANNRLSAKRAERIARYQAARRSLLTKLRENLSRVHDASAEARQRDMADLAADQTPRLLELETEADKIRHDLTHVELFSTSADDIGNLRSTMDVEAGGFAGKMVPPANSSDDAPPFPKLAPVGIAGLATSAVAPAHGSGNLQPRHETPERSAALASLRLILSAAYFRDGFSPEQRRLLKEMALEIQLVIEPEPDANGPASVFFWPAGARIPVPAGLSPESAAKFDEFQQRKSALKSELRATLAREEKHIFNVDSTETYEHLAAAQAPRLAELETLADQIRPALAALADADTKLAMEFPADLARQITSLVERMAALQRELRARLMDFRLELPYERIELIRQNNGLAIAIVTHTSSSRDREPVLARINEFNTEISDRFTALAPVRDRIRDGLARYQATALGVKTGVTVDQLAANFLVGYQARETRNRQRDYAAAVLAPGLAPAQRRLLLAAVAADSLEEPASSSH